MPTAAAGAELRPALGPLSSPIGRLDASAFAAAAAFSPGQVLAGRYRVIGLLGRGGMGEVYRADDLTLGQPVSLKFLPRRMAQTPGLLERFHAEVRNARHVSHPNVCRVYDIGEIDGQPFLTMEFVDGEDLGTLLRRIGHLPTSKAHEVARQLCAGIAAAHDKGVLHRDLKPSNVMIDGAGRVRITDFGLAIRADQAAAGEFAGTPAYMSPEQFEGRPVTERSDLYSLGLILYEIYTGRRPFEAATIGEWRSRHTRSEPTRPSEHGEPLDEATERAILRCLEKDPAKRPASALQLAAALPGGDPVAAALAAGETPSPEMVAASGGEGALSPRAAGAMLAGVVLALATLLAIAPYSTDLGIAPLRRGAESLRERARQVLARFQLDRGAIDSADWFDRDYDPMLYLSRHLPSTRWRRLLRGKGAPVAYFYRQSPGWMSIHSWQGRVTSFFPPSIRPGMTTVTLDGEGALTSLLYLPPDYDTTAASPVGVADWAALFNEAHLDFTRFRRVEPRWQLQRSYDARAEWLGPAPWAPEIELRVTGGSYRGIPTYFAVFGPWTETTNRFGPNRTASARLLPNITLALFVGLLVAGAYLAYRNVRLGRGDRRGAVRLGLFIFASLFLAWVTRTHYVPEFIPMIWNLFNQGFGPAIDMGIFCTSVYLALEPYLRRRMPERLIGWARLLEGRFRDPQVSREVLIGALGGACGTLATHVTGGLPTWIPVMGETTVPPVPDLLYGGMRAVSAVISGPAFGVLWALLLFGVLFLLRLLLRNPVAAMIGTTSCAIALSMGGENVPFETPGAIVTGGIIVLCLARGGLLALAVMFTTRFGLEGLPLPLRSGAPYTMTSLAILALVLGVAVAAFRNSLGTQVRLGRGIAEELG